MHYAMFRTVMDIILIMVTKKKGRIRQIYKRKKKVHVV